jgi:peptidyl-prolyl cis-trans isomerase SurA
MHRRLLLALAALVWLLPAGARADEMLVEGIAAQVGTQIVLISEVMQTVAGDEQRLRAAGAPELEVAKLRAEGLEALIERRLLEKVVEDADLHATEAEIDTTIEAIGRENGLSMEKLRESVTAQGMTYEEYRKEIENELERRKVVNAMIASRVRVEESDVEALYQERFKDQPEGGTTVRLRQVLLPAGQGPGAPTVEQACEMAAKLHQAITGGEAFDTVARQYSAAAPEKGGDIGWLHLESMSDWMIQIVEPLQPGQLSAVAQLPIGCTFVQLVERRDWKPVSFEEAKPALQAEVYERKLGAEYRKWMDELRERTFIERRGYFAEAAKLTRAPLARAADDEAEAPSDFERGLEDYDVLGGAPAGAPAQ